MNKESFKNGGLFVENEQSLEELKKICLEQMEQSKNLNYKSTTSSESFNYTLLYCLSFQTFSILKAISTLDNTIKQLIKTKVK
jgi:hypothetical protein